MSSIVSYLHQCFNAENVSIIYPYIAVERSVTPMPAVSERQRRSLGQLPPPAGAQTLPL